MILCLSKSSIPSSTLHLTAECPRMSELSLTIIAPRTHASGCERTLSVREREEPGREGVEAGKLLGTSRTPACWCWSRASCRPAMLLVRLSAEPPKPVCKGEGGQRGNARGKAALLTLMPYRLAPASSSLRRYCTDSSILPLTCSPPSSKGETPYLAAPTTPAIFKL